MDDYPSSIYGIDEGLDNAGVSAYERERRRLYSSGMPSSAPSATPPTRSPQPAPPPQMPASDAYEKYIQDEIHRRQDHPPSMLRKVLGTAVGLWAPGIGRQIEDPEAARFSKMLPYYAAGSKAEQDRLSKEATIASKQSQDESRLLTAENRQQYAQAQADAHEEATHKGEITEPIQQNPSQVNLGGAPPLQPPVLQNGIGPVDLMAPHNPDAYEPALAPLRSTAVSVPPGAVPPAQGSFQVKNLREQPRGTRQVRLTPEGAAAAKTAGEKTEQVPDLVATHLGLPSGTMTTPAGLEKYSALYVKSLEAKNPTDVSLAMQAAKGDPAKALELLAQTRREGKIVAPNPAREEKAAIGAAVRKAYQDSGGDWNKVLEAARSMQYGDYSSDVAGHATKMLQLPPTQQTKVTAADTTIDTAKRAIEGIDAFVRAHPNLIGSGLTHPINGLVRSFETHTGTEPAEIGSVDQLLESVSALQPGQHGFRSSEAVENFKKSLGIDPRTGKPDGSRAWLINPDKAKNSITELMNFNQSLRDNTLKNAGKGLSTTPGDPKVKAYADQYFGGDLQKALAAIAAQRQGK